MRGCYFRVSLRVIPDSIGNPVCHSEGKARRIPWITTTAVFYGISRPPAGGLGMTKIWIPAFAGMTQNGKVEENLRVKIKK
jgi:hypothetical protein